MPEKVAFIVPGYPYNPSGYSEIQKCFEEEGFSVEPIDPNWSPVLDKNIRSLRQEISDRLENYDDPELYGFGHSWGAVCLLAASRELDFEAQILASLSPEFREDFESVPTYRNMARRLYTRFSGIFVEHLPVKVDERPSLKEIASENSSRIHFLYGEKELKKNSLPLRGAFTEQMIEKRVRLFEDAKNRVVKAAGHSVSSGNYEQKIKQVVKQL